MGEVEGGLEGGEENVFSPFGRKNTALYCFGPQSSSVHQNKPKTTTFRTHPKIKGKGRGARARAERKGENVFSPFGRKNTALYCFGPQSSSVHQNKPKTTTFRTHPKIKGKGEGSEG